MKLRDTIPGMLSPDYKERFTAEYEQLSIRALKLETFMTVWTATTNALSKRFLK